MQKTLLAITMILCGFCFALPVSAAVTFSFSSPSGPTFSPPAEPIRVSPGTVGVSLDVWVENSLNESITGLALDVLSSDPAVLEGPGFTTESPAGRWLSSGNGIDGDLMTGANAVAVPQFGSDGITAGSFVKHGTITFDVTGSLGDTTTLSLAEGDNLIVTQTGSVTGIDFQSIDLTVVPEPSAFCGLCLCVTAAIFRRRARPRSASAVA